MATSHTRPIQQAKGQVVDGHVYPGCSQGLDAAREIARIIERVDPKKLLIGECKARILKPHEGDVVDEGEIASEPFTGLL